MPKLNVFPACRLRAFAALVSRELGVQVRLRGREICVRMDKPPVIFLPNLEYAREEDLLAVYGFALHEAAHILFTRPKVAAMAPDYLTKMTHNAIEDEYIERMLEGRFPGAREMLTRAYVDGIRAVSEGKPVIEPVSWLAPESSDKIREFMREHCMDAADDALAAEVAKRLEIDRAAKMWIIATRGYPLDVCDWATHPWRVVFEQETTPRARSTAQTYEQALRIIARLGVKPVLPADVRNVAPIEEAARAKELVRKTRHALAEARAEIEQEADKRIALEPESKEMVEARSATREAEARDASDPGRDDAIRAASEREQEAQEARNAKRDEIRRELAEARAGELKELLENARAAHKAGRAAKAAAKEARVILEKGDADADRPIAKGAMEAVVEEALRRLKEEPLADELRALESAADDESAVPDIGPAAKYSVFDRSFDRVEPVPETAEARDRHAAALERHARAIDETTRRLRHLSSPKFAKIVAASEGRRLHARAAARIGIALRRAEGQVEKPWQRIEEKRDSQIAVTILVDCSGSMLTPVGSTEQSRLDLAREAAACVSEVCKRLGFTNEILGHTTDSSLIDEACRGEDATGFSRSVPFLGYEFKKFGTTGSAAVFGRVECADNLDGEAVRWAAKRLVDRAEKTKVLLVLCGGLPQAATASIEELERHLLVTCRQIEAQQREGLHLCAIGMGAKRVSEFYKNASVIEDLSSLPKALLATFEKALSPRV